MEPHADNNRSTPEAPFVSRKADIVAVLGRHIDRPIRTFLADRRIRGTSIEEAFWDAVYLSDPEIPFDHAVALVSELECSPKRVGALLEGWRPLASEGEA